MRDDCLIPHPSSKGISRKLYEPPHRQADGFGFDGEGDVARAGDALEGGPARCSDVYLGV